MTKVLVTGANGFIGSHLVDRLLEKNYEVTALVRETSRLGWLKNKPIRMITGDIRFPDTLPDVVKDQDAIFHVAGVINGKNYSDYADTNHTGTENLMNAILKHNPSIQKVIYLSSLSTGGPTTPDHPLTEADPSNPLTAYGKTKYAGERVVLDLHDRLNVIAIRPPVVYGARDLGILGFFQLVSKHVRINLGFRDRYVTMIYVSDLVDALILPIETEIKSGEFYYVSDGTPNRTWLGLQQIIAKALGIWTLKLKVPLTPLFLYASVMHGYQLLTGIKTRINLTRYRLLTQHAWTCDCTKIMNELGYKPKITLEKGIFDTVEWYQQIGWI
ncbi:MAG: NAD(P)-dependent oxidoreductase [Candidatus Marinimicrobia bacterium]|nr:NAD(P)-dependent oxidoreductase [Candidatus Neomarinimicrobiota bacterium]